MTASPSPSSRLHIGPAGWSYADWDGLVYPAGKPKGWHALDILSVYFNLCEINTSFYHIPTVTSARSWARRVAGHPDFLFSVKLWEGFTHQWDSNSGAAPAAPASRDVDAFRACLDALAEANRLGCVLIQFPMSFHYAPGNLEHLEHLAKAFHAYPLAVEVRHLSWQNPEYLEWLRSAKAAFVNIDQPIFSNSLPPTDFVTSNFFYARFHGRNRAAWFAEDQTVEERYNYLYSPSELAPWVDSIRKMNSAADRGFVVTNNHFRGKAVVNGLQLSDELGRKVPAPPESLARAYPEALEKLSHSSDKPPARLTPPSAQLDLFS